MSSAQSPLLTVVSRSFAPQVSGSTILLANLLSHYPGQVNALIGYWRDTKSDPAFRVPCPTQRLALPYRLPRLYDRLERRLPILACYSLCSLIQRALKKLGTDVVLAVYPDGVYLVAAFLAARQLRLPFYAYMHDLWLENAHSGTARGRFAEKWEPVIFKQATRVLCMTEAMQAHYEKKYGIRTALLPHTIAERDYLQAPSAICPPKTPQPTVLFVGAVSPLMNLDALKVLAVASELLLQGYKLLYCTSVNQAALHKMGIYSSRLQVQYASRHEVQRLQSEAHVLVAPLSHKDCSVDEVRTVFSTKLLEYLVSGRPTVVFAPEDSYHAESASKRGWGYVVTEDSPAALAAAIMKVHTDEELAARLVQGALQEAEARRAIHQAPRLHKWVLTDVQHPPF